MPTSDEKAAQQSRVEKIRAIVNEDFERISSTDDPYVILNLDRDAGREELSERYERYEKFYRAENFQRFGDMDLTRKALDVRRAIGRAMVVVQGELGDARSNPTQEKVVDETHIPQVDDNCAALGDIYFRDGLTYLKLSDLNSASDCLQRAVDYDPSRGIVLGYYAYTRFKLRSNDPEVIKNTRSNLKRAAEMSPDDAEIHVLRARFGINTSDLDLADRSIVRVQTLNPHHPKLGKLKKRVKKRREL